MRHITHDITHDITYDIAPHSAHHVAPRRTLHVIAPVRRQGRAVRTPEGGARGRAPNGRWSAGWPGAGVPGRAKVRVEPGVDRLDGRYVADDGRLRRRVRHGVTAHPERCRRARYQVRCGQTARPDCASCPR